ncbi:MAG: DUF924 family protein [Methyloligellaceae bacterium]
MERLKPTLPEEAETVLKFWFEEITPDQWWRSNELDDVIRNRFLPTLEELKETVPVPWLETPKVSLAAIIVLDQFPRNIFRNQARSFATDAKALAVSFQSIENGFDKALGQNENIFLYMPLQHSEDLAHQEQSVRLYEKLGSKPSFESAKLHRDIIKKFGRFPHRNNILNRTTTQEEQEFLNEGALFW